jgi:peptide/nickel transport system ATP-binding protein
MMVNLSVRDLHVTYRTRTGGVPAVRGVSFDLAWGHSLGIAGESGCGKSTMGAALLRLLPKDATVTGDVLLNGEDVYAMKFGRLRAVRWTEFAIVFQGALHALNPVREIGWQIGEAIELHDRDLGGKAIRARVGELLEQVGLSGRRASDFPHQLSGGQRQRVMIAMALACRPHLLIADEPTTALDVMVQAQVLELLQELRVQQQLGMIFITHDLSLLTYVCERIAVMYAGRIVEEGPSDEVFESPTHPYTAALSAAFPTIGDRSSRMAPTGLAGDPPDPTDLPPGCSFAPRCSRVEPRCHDVAIELRDAGALRRAACIHVGSEVGA